MLTTVKPTLNTLEDFLKLPETEPASEFIEGEVIQKPMPQGQHSSIQVDLCETINQVAKPQKIAKAFSELRCTFGGSSVVPDVSVWRWARIPFLPSGRIANRFEMAPDWAIEILSPQQNFTKVLTKLLHCSRHGTELGWLINPEEDSILVILPEQKIELYTQADRLPVLTEIPLNLTVATVFSWLTFN